MMITHGRKIVSDQESTDWDQTIDTRYVDYGRQRLELGGGDYGLWVVLSIMMLVLIGAYQHAYLHIPIVYHLASLVVVMGVGWYLFYRRREDLLIRSGIIPQYKNSEKIILARAYRACLDAEAYNQLLSRWRQYMDACALGLRERMSPDEERCIIDRFQALHVGIKREIGLVKYANSVPNTDARIARQSTQSFIQLNDLHDLPTRLRVEPSFDQRPDSEMLAAIKEVDALLKAKER